MKKKEEKENNVIGISFGEKTKHGRQKFMPTRLIFKQGSTPAVNNWPCSDQVIAFLLTLKGLLYISK